MSPIIKNSTPTGKIENQQAAAGCAYRNDRLVYQCSGKSPLGGISPYPVSIVGAFAGIQEIVDIVASPAHQQTLIGLMNPIVDVFIS